MTAPYDEQSSGRILPNEPVDYSIGSTFSDLEEMTAGGYNRLLRGVRYGKWFVLKGLKADDDEMSRSMLRKEFEIMVQLDHPNIVRVYSFEEVVGVGLCIVMEYVDGMPLDQWLATKPSKAARRRVTRQLLDAMSHWHQKQVVHRDLKPSNVLITRNGSNVRVIDFGLSEADHYAILKEPAYTLSYASPEQIEGGPLDGRSDIYSFGRLLGLIFTPPTFYSLVKARCCRHRRERRYPSAEAVKVALQWWRVLPWVVAAAATVLAGLLAHSLLHYDSGVFSHEVAPGQVLRVQVVDSEAHVVGVDTLSGDLRLPERVRRGLFSYPLRTIDPHAFAGCEGLTSVRFPSTLRRIEDAAFHSCIHLADTLILPEGLVYLGDHVFDNCERLRVCRVESRHLHLKDEPERGGRFGNTISMHDIVVAGTVDTLCEGLFYWAYWGVHDVWLEEGLTHLGNGSFSELYNLERIHFPSTLRTIDANCFYGCGVPRLTIPDNVEAVEEYGLALLFQCRYLELGSGLKRLGPMALYWLGRDGLDTLIFRSPEPPAATHTTFNSVNSEHAVVLVPAASLPLYQADTLYAGFHLVGY